MRPKGPLADPERCEFAAPQREIPGSLHDGLGGLVSFSVPLEILRYRPTGTAATREIEIPYPGGQTLNERLWYALREKAFRGDATDDTAVAADVWFRVYGSFIEKHFFKWVYWQDFFNDTLASTSKLRGDALATLEQWGKPLVGKSIDEVLVRLHFDEEKLPPPDDGRAGQYFEEIAKAVVAEELAVIKMRGVDHVLVGHERAEHDKRVRSRLKKFIHQGTKLRVRPDRLHLEAFLRYLEALNPFYEAALASLAGELSPLSQKIFRLIHITGPRLMNGRTLRVPIMHSNILKDMLMFGLGDQPGDVLVPAAVLLPDLLAVLDGEDPADPRYAPTIRKALGLVEALRVWARSIRGRQRENRQLDPVARTDQPERFASPSDEEE